MGTDYLGITSSVLGSISPLLGGFGTTLGTITQLASTGTQIARAVTGSGAPRPTGGTAGSPPPAARPVGGGGGSPGPVARAGRAVMEALGDPSTFAPPPMIPMPVARGIVNQLGGGGRSPPVNRLLSTDTGGRRGHYDRMGNFVPQGTRAVRGINGEIVYVKAGRHINPFNPRALSRAARRIHMFNHRVRKYVRLEHPGRKVKVNPFRHVRRRRSK